LGIASEITFADYTNMDSDLQTTEIINADGLLSQFSIETWDTESIVTEDTKYAL
jgi:hypothetical protein